jgi:VWFA-related protein
VVKAVVAAVCLGLMWGGGVARAQEPAGGSSAGGASTIRVTTRIVVLDVVVTDKKGNVVTRPLGKDDFTVLEDGVPQTLRSFETPAEHVIPAGAGPAGAAVVNSAADLKKIGDAPVTVLVLDELNSTFEEMSYARQMMVKYLQKQPAVLKEPTVLMIAANTTFKQVHDYTQNRDELIEVVKKHMPAYPLKLMTGGRSGSAAVERMAAVLAALQQIGQASSGTPGRKNLIWVGNGFPSANLVGMPTDEANLIEAAYRRCTARLLAARITVYTINPTANSSATIEVDSPDDLNQVGAEEGVDPFGEGNVSFASLAPATGGISYGGRNDLENVIGEGIAKGQQYYTMSYAPTNKSDDALKFRKIRVEMKDPGLRATTRSGYYPETAADLNPVLDKTMSEKQVKANLQLDLSAALTSTIAYNGLAVTAEKTGPGQYVLHVAEKGIGWSDAGSDGAQHEEATVAAAWYDAKGKILGHVARELTSVRGAGSVGATFPLTVAPTGAVRMRFVVRDALNGAMGTVDVKP